MGSQMIDQRRILPAHTRSYANSVAGYNASAIDADKVVAVTGWDGAYAEVTVADFTSVTHQSTMLLIADIGVAAGKRLGAYVPWKILKDVNTGGSAFGAPVYGSIATAGAWTLTKPSSNARQIGVVLEVHATTGVILLDPMGVVPFARDILLQDNVATAWEVKEGTTTYLKMVTTNSSERIEVSKPIVKTGSTPQYTAEVQALTTKTNGQTATAGEFLSGMIYMDASGGNVGFITPTAAQLVAAVPGCKVGTTIDVCIASNHATNSVTITPGANVNAIGSMVSTQTGAYYKMRFTNIGSGTEAVSLIRVG